MFNLSIVRLLANRKIESDILAAACDQVTLRLCQNDGNTSDCCLCFFFLSSVIKVDKKCANSIQRLTIVSAKSKIHSPRRGYLSPKFRRFGNINCFIIHQRHKFLLNL